MQRTLHIARHSERAHELLQHTAAGSPHTKPSERVAVIHPEPTDDKCLQAVEQLTLTVTILNYLVQHAQEKHTVTLLSIWTPGLTDPPPVTLNTVHTRSDSPSRDQTTPQRRVTRLSSNMVTQSPAVKVVSRSLFIKIIGVICTFNMLCIK